IPAMDRDGIKWNDIVEKSGEFDILAPNAQLNYTFTEQHQWHLIVFHVVDAGDDGVVELNVENSYSNDKLMPALIMSIFSLWITSFILYRIYRLKKAGLPIICSLPSHTWDSHSEEA
ncbi:MAG: hypothetical protein QGH90_07290, partial [Candidatus Poseidoniaceae archaeon]|nr:hypothetical protein [Candidatus Poseidoniaceae archaeon]